MLISSQWDNSIRNQYPRKGKRLGGHSAELRLPSKVVI